MSEDLPPESPPDPAPSIAETVARLARPHPSGGHVVERASLLAAGNDLDGALRWITEHGGEPEYAPAAAPRGGLFGPRADATDQRAGSGNPQRFVLPAGALDGP